MSQNNENGRYAPFVLDIETRAARFSNRLLQFNQFAGRELGAYGLFRRIALATMATGLDPVCQPHVQRHVDYSCTSIYFPTINYEPDFSDRSTRRQISLRLDQYKHHDTITDATPWLSVHTMEQVEQHGIDPDHEEHGFVRWELEVIAGRRDGSDAPELFDAMLNEKKSQERQTILNKQKEYIDWLQKAAVALEVSPTFYEVYPHAYPDSSILG